MRRMEWEMWCGDVGRNGKEVGKGCHDSPKHRTYYKIPTSGVHRVDFKDPVSCKYQVAYESISYPFLGRR